VPDLLTHVLTGYVLGTVLSLRYDWLTPQYVTVVMVGAIVPDVAKIDLLVDSDAVTAVLGIPFDWFAIHTLGGSLVAVAVGAVLAGRDHRRVVFALLAVGACSHLFLDALLLKPTGHSFRVLFPLTASQPPTPGLYHSTDRWPAAVAGVVAAAVWLIRSRASPTLASVGQLFDE